MQDYIPRGQPNQHATFIPDGELALAREIHRSLLPRDYVSADVEIAVRYREADRLGGDYATIQPKPNGNVFLAMCDVSGHGVAAALLAARVNSFVRDHAEQSRDLCDLAESLNRFIFEHFYFVGVFATFVAAEIRPARHEILFSSWAHPPGLLYHTASGTFERLGAQRPAIGVMRELRQPCTTASARYQPGDRLLFYTDGITEARNSGGQSFGIERLQEFLRAAPVSLSSAEAAQTILAEVETFRDQQPCDDKLVMAVRFRDHHSLEKVSDKRLFGGITKFLLRARATKQAAAECRAMKTINALDVLLPTDSARSASFPVISARSQIRTRDVLPLHEAIPLWFVISSPLIGLIIGFLGAWLVTWLTS